MCVNVVFKRYERKCHIYWKVDLGQRSMLKLPREPSKMESSAQNLVATDMGHVDTDCTGIKAEFDDIRQWCKVKIDLCKHGVLPGEEEEFLAKIQVKPYSDFLFASFVQSGF